MTTEVDRRTQLDPFVHEHERLHQALGELRGLLKERHSPKKVARAFAEFAEHVQAHFVHEEAAEGFFDSVVAEHATLSRELTGLLQHAKESVVSDESWSRLSEEFDLFWRSFCRHERSENDLVQEAFHDDIGSKD
ncbi:MAG: hypothetical protein HYV60_11950 [Planctomycetia bacterium]|nr:hypothetical protein [Planctomycetia bacterium]